MPCVLNFLAADCTKPSPRKELFLVLCTSVSHEIAQGQVRTQSQISASSGFDAFEHKLVSLRVGFE